MINSPSPINGSTKLWKFGKGLPHLKPKSVAKAEKKAQDTPSPLFPIRPLTRVESTVDFLDMGAIEVGVDLSRGDVRMTQHGLDRAEVGAPFEEMSRKGPFTASAHTILFLTA